jgi:hypothetical protein
LGWRRRERDSPTRVARRRSCKTFIVQKGFEVKEWLPIMLPSYLPVLDLTTITIIAWSMKHLQSAWGVKIFCSAISNRNPVLQ